MARSLEELHIQLAAKERLITQIDTFQELGVMRQQALQELVPRHLTLTQQVPLEEINLIHEWIIRQCIQLSIQALAIQGMGDLPPMPYAFLLFGSGGRKEQIIISDQDHALIYSVPSERSQQDQEEIHQYFGRLSTTLTQGLTEAGYPPCEGNVMASNPRWRGTREYWINLIDNWCEEPTWENIRHLLLVSDGRLLSGEEQLFQEFQTHLHHQISSSPWLLSRFVSNTLHHQVPLGWFNRLLPEIQGKYRDAINIKNGAYLPFVNCVRLFALANGIRETSTLERLEQLHHQKVFPPDLVQSIKTHFQQIVSLRFLAANQWQDQLYQSNSYLKLAELSKADRLQLKESLKLALVLQELTTKTYAKAE